MWLPGLKSERRKWVLGSLVLLAIGGAVCLWLASGGGGKLSRANYERVRKGMSIAEVEAILGPPTQDLRNSVEFDGRRTQGWLWLNDSTRIFVYTNDTGVVIDSDYIEMSIPDRLRDWWQRLATRF